ncbi:MAG: hypothetical protein ABL974_13540 [Prosthecobacter sp.]
MTNRHTYPNHGKASQDQTTARRAAELQRHGQRRLARALDLPAEAATCQL